MAPWRVPLSDVRFAPAEVEAVAAAYRSGWLSQGPAVAEFERAFASFVGVEHAVAVSSGTAALHLALLVAGIGAGDEVILPSLTFAATVATVLQAGADPVFADIEALDRPWLSVRTVEPALGPRTRAVISMTYAGHPGEARALRGLADERGLILIEDAAHALGARAGDAASGSLGHLGAFSFFANKNLPLGEGGMLISCDAARAERARRLRSHGLSAGTWERHHGADALYDVLEPGFNYRLDEARAALGRRLLARLPASNSARAAHAAAYAAGLAGLDGAQPALAVDPDVSCAWHIYPVLLAAGLDRGRIRDDLTAAGIQTSIHYPPLHDTTAFAHLRSRPLPITEEFGARTLTLPLFPHMSGTQHAQVMEALAQVLQA
jgi:dTDP-4-amino-4,6-dideoxygalactose transaminase